MYTGGGVGAEGGGFSICPINKTVQNNLYSIQTINKLI